MAKKKPRFRLLRFPTAVRRPPDEFIGALEKVLEEAKAGRLLECSIMAFYDAGDDAPIHADGSRLVPCIQQAWHSEGRLDSVHSSLMVMVADVLDEIRGKS